MVPDDVAEFGREAARRLRDVLGKELVGVYFVGSVALGGYVPGESDIDVVAVSGDHVDRGEKQQVVETLLDPGLPCPGRGLEFTLYRRDVAGSAPVDGDFEVNVNGGPRMVHAVNFDDKEQPRFWFVLDRAIAQRHGVVISGPSAGEVFAEVSRSTLLEVMVESMSWHRMHERLGFDSVLNASRAWRFAVEDALCSKLDGATWARARWREPSLIDAAVELRHGHPAVLDNHDLHVFLDHVEDTLSDARTTET
jgi:hypothetical protein